MKSCIMNLRPGDEVKSRYSKQWYLVVDAKCTDRCYSYSYHRVHYNEPGYLRNLPIEIDSDWIVAIRKSLSEESNI